MIDSAHKLRATWRRPSLVHPIHPYAGAVTLLLAALWRNSTPGVLLGLAAIAAVVAVRRFREVFPWMHPRLERGTVALGPSGDWFWNDTLVAKPGKVRQASVVPPEGNDPALLHVELGSGDVFEFEVQLADARRFLEAAQLDSEHAVATFTIASRADTHPFFSWVLRGAPIAVIAVGFLLRSSDFGVLAIPPIVLLVLANAIPTRVRVGADAIDWRWLIFRKRVVYRELRDAKYGRTSIAFERRDGSRVVLRSGTSEKHIEVHRRVKERVERALRVYARQIETPKFDPRMLDRHGDTVEDWLERLRALNAPVAEDYRAAPVDRSAIVALVHDTTLSSARRAAALVAIVGTLGAEQRGRLAANAKGMLDADLRAAIQAALANDEASLRRAMEALTRD